MGDRRAARSTWARARGPLPAQVLPLVRGAPRAHAQASRIPLVTAERRPTRARLSALASSRPWPPRAAATLRRPSGSRAGGFLMARETVLTPEGSKSSRRRSSTSRPSAGARWPSASRRRASSATSPRTPSTTTPRTSRRCSRSRSPTSRRSSAAPGHRREAGQHRRRGRRRDRARQGPEDRQVAASTRSSAPPRPTRPRASSRTSRRSARRCSATSAARSSRCPCRAARRASSRSRRSKRA